ncbi:unnamed protein product [Penicillium salamii]|uniref:GB1/RHD3-type G domain-containing protein n=1 Tax=Penicillium salamii TaxID=1612424 RepID=A0A9W4NEY0_9EURO|nr:unnamed protein product [Penicillium salamii]CAG8357589.1 unnamed protein product [Penicillium salamii]CAG8368272.1 unnamed protein product [Penicillium salamii]CAG8398377.1 unnamed protein product [Penicillium salamii]
MTERRPSGLERSPTAPSVLSNGHFASVGAEGDAALYEHGVQVIDGDKEFNPNLSKYLSLENVTPAGFNYHLISVFGSQSTGKSTLLNNLFGTDFTVMSDQERRQTTKGIWLSKNKKQGEVGAPERMADNILVMDVEGTDGRERGEDQDFERKSALFALATSEVLIVNIWEHQVGLYQGANMGLLKTVFEVNLQLFLKDKHTSHRSLLFFVVRDFVGTTPLKNLQKTLLEDLGRLWDTISKPAGFEKASIHDYFDFQFYGLPHKSYQPVQFVEEVQKLGTRFRDGHRDLKRDALKGEFSEGGVFLPEYHRRIPADGFSHYAESIWDQIVNNKDLDLPTQQELLAQFRCDEILREVMVGFDEVIIAFEDKQAEAVRLGAPEVLGGLGVAMRGARSKCLKSFETDASRYHKGVYQRKTAELQGKVDTRLKALFLGQLSAAHKSGIRDFSDSVSALVKDGQKKGGSYDFAEIVTAQAQAATEKFEQVARSTVVDGASWSNYKQELSLYQKELAEVSARLRRDEMRRLATRVERWVQSRLGESVGIEFNALGSGRAGAGAPENGDKPTEKDFWDRIWNLFEDTVLDAERRFTDRASSFDASLDEVDVGLWRLRRKSWGVLRAKIDEEMTEGNLLLKLRENFEDKFRYDEDGVPRIWRPTDDIEGIYTRARESTLTVIPLLSRFRLDKTTAPPPLDRWVGHTPSTATSADEEDLAPIGGVDEDEGKSLEEEMTILSDSKRQELTVRFKKAADGVYVEAKRSAIGGITQVPLYFYGLLLALGWNEIWAVLRNPAYFFLLFVLAIGAYITYTLNLWGPMLKMTEAASGQALVEGKRRLREFLESSDTGRQAIAMSAGEGGSRRKEEYEMSDMQKSGSKAKDDLDDM